MLQGFCSHIKPWLLFLLIFGKVKVPRGLPTHREGRAGVWGRASSSPFLSRPLGTSVLSSKVGKIPCKLPSFTHFPSKSLIPELPTNLDWISSQLCRQTGKETPGNHHLLGRGAGHGP